MAETACRPHRRALVRGQSGLDAAGRPAAGEPVDPPTDECLVNAAIAAVGTRVQLSNLIFNTSRKAGKVVAEGSFFLSILCI